MKVIFFGTPDFAAQVLEYLLAHGVDVAAVITKPDRPQGRSKALVPTPVKVIAEKHKLPLYQPAIVSDPDFAPTLQAFTADLFVVVAFGEIIKQHLLDMPPKGCINLHASLLPKYRGAAPIQRSIMDGELKTGVTIMHMVKKMDAGDMIKTVEVSIGPDDAFPFIEKQLCTVGSQALLEVIHAIDKNTAGRTPQDHALATLAPKIELEDCEINWSVPAQTIHNLIRGVTPEPGAWCFVDVRKENKRLKIFSSRVIKDQSGTPGTILSYGKSLVVACGNDALEILQVQLEGKKAMAMSELMRGVPGDQFKFKS